MAVYLPWLSLLLWVGLVGASIYLFLDGRGHRRALDAAQATLVSLQRQTTAHDVAIGNLTRAVALLVPPDARPTTAHAPGVAPRAAPRAVRALPGSHPAIGLSRPFRPSPEQIEQARGAHREALLEAMPPLDTTGDRGGINPGDPIPSDSDDAIRARFEAEADARSQARGQLPGAEGEPPEDERTRVYQGIRIVKRPTLLGGLAGASPERPVSSATRTAEAFRKAHPSSPTLLSEGVTRQTLTPTDPGTPILDARIRRRWAELCAEAQDAGKVVGHCHQARCMSTGEGIDRCECDCDGCDLALTLLVKADQDIRGPVSGS